MGTLADSLFNVLMSWVRALVNAIWALFTTDHTTLLEFLGKNWVLIVVVILAAGLEAGLIGAYLWDSSRFEGLFPQIISQLSLFARFYTIVNGVFDVTAIVYYLSVTGFFLFLSVQSLEKRRWSE